MEDIAGKTLDVIIVGSGPAGLTAALYAARADLKPLVFEGPEPGGQLTTTTDVENYPGYPDGVLGPKMMEDFRKQATRFGADCRWGTVSGIDFDKRPYKVTVDEKTEVYARSLIVSTGASAKWLGLESEQRLRGHGVSACATCDGAFFRDQHVVIIGGGDTAMEEAQFLTKFASKVTLLHRRDELRASKIMQKRTLDNPKVEVMWNSVLEEVLGDKVVEGVKVRNVKTDEVSTLDDVTGVFLAIGHKPNTDLFKGVLDMDETGYILTEPKSTYTNMPGIFACGDAQDKDYRQAVTAAGTGCMAAIDAERWLAEQEVAEQEKEEA
ncbi:thioredoxin-disulfide reductase [Natronogracilivirga saccharolytica]|uniref:Thioredoxin reductase n=1 Tax=Natronogracilivirga saccharolytica TaxID=2812953 RepID=A0A8J7S7I7_9BACT|nr:thioredoxin-disulfide reductase [Natronogracilivirga saccharolytica]MBP3191648.1 thioredoxin-disulfide reductase [Natronogracilivirga saccharolytica]